MLVAAVAVLAQATEPEDPDLTVPLVTIAASAVITVIALVVARRRSRRRTRLATPEELDLWQLEGGRLLDQWVDEVETEVQARRTAVDPALVSRSDDPLGLGRAIDEIPDARLAPAVAELRAAGAALLAAVRDGDPHGPQALGAEARFDAAKAQAGSTMAALRGSPQPQ
jgi:hypothetical protein